MRKTEFVNGACFGYYDDTFEECQKCRGREQCQKAAKSPEVEQVRRKPKTSRDAVEKLLGEWS